MTGLGLRVGAVSWAVTAAALALAAYAGPTAWAIAATAAAVALVVLARVRVDRVAVVVAALVALGVGVVVWRVVPLRTDPLAELAGGRALVVADVVVTLDPAPRAGRTAGSRRTDDGWQVDGAVREWQAPGRTAVQADLPVRVLTTEDVRAVLPGAVLRVHARVIGGAVERGRAATLVAEKVEVLAPAPPVQVAAGAVRTALRLAVADRPPDAAALLPGLVVGDTSAVPADLDQAMRDSGLAHLTAVSGGNVAVVVLVVLGAARALGLRRGRAQLVVVAAGVAGYVVLARPQPSVVRAAAMAGVVLVALALDRRVRGSDALGWAVAALVLLDPFLALSLGFAMSVLATGALLLLARRLDRSPPAGRWPRARAGVLGMLAVSAAAQAAVAPLVAGIGGGVPVGGLLANLLAAPVVAPATVLGLVAGLVGPWWPAAATGLAVPACWCVGWIAAVARWSADVLGVLPWPTGAAGAALLAAVLAGAGLAVVVARRTSGPLLSTAMAVLAVAGVVVLAPPTGVPPSAAWPPAGWRVVMCDVGQGDAVVLDAGQGSAVVVDAGPDPRAIDRCLGRLGVVRVPLVVLTHFHADHVEGLPGVLRGRSVGTVVVSPLAEPASEASRVRRWLAAAGVGSRVAAPGDRWSVAAVDLRVVWPTRVLRGQGSDPNNASVTLVGTDAVTSLLLGGDLEPAAQDAVLAAGAVGHVDVVKVPHHGSAKQSPGWLARATPAVAVIGVGLDNDYGHPSPAVVTAYRAAGVLLGRTDLDGDLAVLRDEQGRLGLVRRGR
jgi:competence protein ComEC